MSGFEIIKNPDVLQVIIDGVEKGIATIANNVRSQAVDLAPVDTAQLKNSIVWKTSKGGSGGKIEGVPDPKPMQGYVGSSLDYAVYQEFGTRKMAPQPYLRPAIAIKALGRRGADVMIEKQNEIARLELTPSNITKRETFGVGKLT